MSKVRQTLQEQPNGITLFPNLTEPSWSLDPLYTTNKAGKWLVWQIMFDGNLERLITLHGQLGGNLIRNEKQVVLNQSGRSMRDQAFLEASSRHKKKVETGYSTFQNLKIQVSGETTQLKKLPRFDVMLSQEYDQARVFQWPVSGEPKFDGIRAYSKIDSNSSLGIALKSRNHKDFPWCNHIRSQLLSFFKYLPVECILDGELYNHDLTFEQISSAVRRVETMSPNNPLLKYYIFDIFESNQLVFEDRYNLLVSSYNQFINDGNEGSFLVIVPMTMLFSDDEVKLAEADFVKQGFEGVIVRQFAGTCIGDVSGVQYTEPTTGLTLPIRFCSMPPTTRTSQSIKLSQYKPKRSYNLMKYKTFKTEEGVVIDIVSGQGTREDAGILVIRDIRGNEFRISPQGSVETHKQWLLNKHKYIGQPYTFKYQELSEYGVPRFPVGISFRDYE